MLLPLSGLRLASSAACADGDHVWPQVAKPRRGASRRGSRSLEKRSSVRLDKRNGRSLVPGLPFAQKWVAGKPDQRRDDTCVLAGAHHHKPRSVLHALFMKAPVVSKATKATADTAMTANRIGNLPVFSKKYGHRLPVPSGWNKAFSKDCQFAGGWVFGGKNLEP